MGTFRVTLEIGGPKGERFVGAPALADTGAACTLAAAVAPEGLGPEPTFILPFVLADGRVVEQDLTETRVRLNGQVRTTIVIFGDPGNDNLMGAYTLEGFGVMVDPINRRMVPIDRFPIAPDSQLNLGESTCGRS